MQFMTNVQLLHVSDPPDVIHVTGSIWMRSLQITYIETCLHRYSGQNINSYKLVLEAAHYHMVLISQYCNFMLVNFMYFRIFIY